MKEIEERVLRIILGMTLGLPMGIMLWYLSGSLTNLLLGVGSGFALGILLYQQDRRSA